jgi:hypothetical protein
MPWTCAPCLKNPTAKPIAYLDSLILDAVGYVAAVGDVPIVVFRGTQSIENWIEVRVCSLWARPSAGAVGFGQGSLQVAVGVGV